MNRELRQPNLCYLSTASWFHRHFQQQERHLAALPLSVTQQATIILFLPEFLPEDDP